MAANRTKGTVQLGVEMSPELRESLRARAASEDRTIKAVILRAINLYLSTPIDGVAIVGSAPASAEKGKAKRK